MTRQEIYDLYVLQSKNVRKLKRVQDNLVKDINRELKRKDVFQAEMKTKLLALLFSTLSEAQFIQIAHTPDGFNATEIQQIKAAKNAKLEDGWTLMIELAMNKVNNSWQANADLSGRRNQLVYIVNDYIIEPSILRNKIAHGQWEYALNRENTQENQALTQELRDLDVVTIQKWFEVHQYMALIIRDLVQSPTRGFHNNYWVHLTALQSYLARSTNWSLTTKLAAMQQKEPKVAATIT